MRSPAVQNTKDPRSGRGSRVSCTHATRSIWARLVDPPPVSNEPLAAVNEAAPNRSKPQIRSSNHSAIRLNGLVLKGQEEDIVYVLELKPQAPIHSGRACFSLIFGFDHNRNGLNRSSVQGLEILSEAGKLCRNVQKIRSGAPYRDF